MPDLTKDGLPIFKSTADTTADGLPIFKKKDISTDSTSTSTQFGSGLNPFQSSQVDTKSPSVLSPKGKEEYQEQVKAFKPQEVAKEGQPKPPKRADGGGATAFMKGLNDFNSSVFNTPRLLYDAASSITDTALQALNLQQDESNYDDIVAASGYTSPLSVLDRLGDYYEGKSNQYAKRQEKFDKGIMDSFTSGDIKGGGKQLWNNIAGSIPSMVGMAVTGGAGNIAKLKYAQKTLASALPFISGRNAELAEDESIPKPVRVVNATLNGLSEVIFDQSFGTQAMIGKVVDAFKDEGRDAAVKVAKDFTKGFATEAIKKIQPFTGTIKGTVEEMSTTLSQNLVDKYTINPDKDLMEGVLDAGLVGGTMTGGISALGTVAYSSSQKKQVGDLMKQREEIVGDLDNENLPDDVKEDLSDKLSKIDKSITKIDDDNESVVSQLSDEDKTVLKDKEAKIQSIEQALQDESLSETAKETLADRLLKEQDKVDEILTKEPDTEEQIIAEGQEAETEYKKTDDQVTYEQKIKELEDRADKLPKTEVVEESVVETPTEEASGVDVDEFVKEVDDERITFSTKDGKGSIILTESTPKFELLPDITEKQLAKLGLDEDDFITKIEHIEVDKSLQGQGIGTSLMNKAIKEVIDNGEDFIYLNASPVGNKALSLNDLTKFYEKFGFKIIKRQGGNNLMGATKTQLTDIWNKANRTQSPTQEVEVTPKAEGSGVGGDKSALGDVGKNKVVDEKSALADIWEGVYESGKKTNNIGGYEFTKTPSFEDGVEVNKLDDGISKQIESQIYVGDNKNVLAKGVEYLSGGWHKVSEDSFGGTTLYNTVTKEAVELNHKKGGRSGIVIQDFLKNNSRYNDNIAVRGSKFTETEHNPKFGGSGHYKGTYFYVGLSSESKALEHGKNLSRVDISDANLYEIGVDGVTSQTLKNEAKKAGYDTRDASGYAESEYLKKQGYDGIKRGNEIILFEPKKFEVKEKIADLPNVSGGTVKQSVPEKGATAAFISKYSDIPLQMARREKYLDSAVMSNGKQTTERKLIEERVKQGWKVTKRTITDDAASKKLNQEYERLKRTAPIGNENHPETKRLRELEKMPKSLYNEREIAVKKEELRLESPEGTTIAITPFGEDYVNELLFKEQSIKEQPKAETPNQEVKDNAKPTISKEVPTSKEEVNEQEEKTSKDKRPDTVTGSDTTVEGEVDQLAEFKDIVDKSKTLDEAFKKAQSIKGIPKEVSQQFNDTYNPKGELTPKQTFEKFYNETKSDKKEVVPLTDNGNDAKTTVKEPVTELKEEKEKWTESKDLNRIFSDAKKKYGEKDGSKYNDVVNRLVNPNENTIIEVRANGVVVKEDGKYLLKPFTNTDANYKKWQLARPLDVTDQYVTTKSEPSITDAFTAIEEAKKSKKTQKGKLEVGLQAVKEMGEVGKKAIFIDNNFKDIIAKVKEFKNEKGEPFIKIECP